MIYPSQRIYLVRHGETEWSASDRHTGLTDIDLTTKGEEQAAHLRKRLAGHSFERVFTSPLKRAYDTCILAGYEKQAERLPSLVEWNYGKYEGLTTAEIHKTDPNWSIFTHGAPGGESIAEVSERASHVLAKLKECKKDVLIFSHGHFLRLLAARWIEQAPTLGKAFCLSAASLSILGHERKTSALILWNDTSHLNLSQ